MRIAGIDEAGKGPVIGPLVICGVCVSGNQNSLLERMGVKDSKKLTPEKRIKIAKEIKNIADVYLIKIHPPQLDKLMNRKTINEIILENCVKIINNLSPDLVYIDCPHVNPKKFESILKTLTKSEVIASHKADEKYPIVAAASILAKVERDREIEKIKMEINENFGSGYPHDEKTIAFLKRIIKKGNKLPWFVRKKWKTISNLSQKDLLSFGSHKE